MALGQLGSNIDTDIQTALGCKYTRVHYRIEVSHPYDVVNIISTSPLQSHNGPPIVELFLMFFVDQTMKEEKENIFEEIDVRVGDLLKELSGRLISRSMEPRSDDIFTMAYNIKLPDYDTFLVGLNRLARTVSDREFTKVLEEKLTD